jgi:hypothetical protein
LRAAADLLGLKTQIATPRRSRFYPPDEPNVIAALLKRTTARPIASTNFGAINELSCDLSLAHRRGDGRQCLSEPESLAPCLI